MSDLQACPFCGNGGRVDPRHSFVWNYDIQTDVAIQCGQCGARGPWFRIGKTSEQACTDAAAAWNRRAAGEDAAPVAVPWQPQFDVMSPRQEDLVRQFCAEIAGPRGQPGSPPDPVRLLEMAQALYLAEFEECGPESAKGVAS